LGSLFGGEDSPALSDSPHFLWFDGLSFDAVARSARSHVANLGEF
jgi:hypothetical protein